nr:hypothetical protein [Tanacetum cinerariifolium]
KRYQLKANQTPIRMDKSDAWRLVAQDLELSAAKEAVKVIRNLQAILQCKAQICFGRSTKDNHWRVGKGFSRIETPLFEGMLLEQEIAKEGDAAEHVKEVNVGDPAEGDDSAAHREVPNVTDEPSIPSPTRPTPLP